MSTQPKQNIDQALQNIRVQIITTNVNAQQSALNGFDTLVQQLQIASQQLQSNQQQLQIKDAEIFRLQKLCEKNKIDHTKKPKESKIAPPK